MYGVVFALTTSKFNSNTLAKHIEEWTHANKVCRHTLLVHYLTICSMCIAPTRKQKIFKTSRYRINEYHKLLEDIKVENIALRDESFLNFWLKNFHSPELTTNNKWSIDTNNCRCHILSLIITEDTSIKECVARTEALSTKENMVKDDHSPKR